MANISFTTDSKIIRDLYDTPEQAIEASRAIGCDGGYRTYLINNQTKYVPCSSFVEYERALRYRVAQGKIGAFGSDTFGDKLVGLQFANAKDEIAGDPYFTLGNFGINKSVPLTQNQIRQTQLNLNAQSIQNDTIKSFTVESIAERNLSYFEGKSYIETLKKRVEANITATVLFDKRKLENYVLFSSLKDRLKNVLLEIYNMYPAAIKLSAVSILNPSIVNYVSFPIERRSDFKVNLYGINNPFGVEYTSSGTTLDTNETITKYRNFSKTFKDYVVYYNGIEYPILSATLPSNYNDDTNGIRITVDGDPFSSLVNLNGSLNVTFYIKPKQKIYDDFFENLSDLASFLLNKDDNGNYVSEFLFPKLSDSGEIVNVKETVYFPKFDEFNIDMFGDEFDKYTTKLNDLADSYDSVKTNLIARFLTTDSLREFDTDDRKVNLIFQLYGKQFDDVKKYIDGITFMRNISYNKIENVPDLLIKNFASMLGFKTYEIEDENTLIESLFQFDSTNTTKSITPAELDIEIWRRIMINAFYLFKSKGTRKSIEFILKLVGLPDEVFDLNEYVYLVDGKLNVTNTLNSIYNDAPNFTPTTIFDSVPFDVNGYPTVPKTVRYQENGGYIYEDNNNVGSYDFGKKYINEFRKFNNTKLFTPDRTVDNVKSWVYSDNIEEYVSDNVNGFTEYTTASNNLVINSKELEVYLALNKVFDVAVYRQYLRNIGIVNADLNINSALKFNASNLSFNQFIKKSLDNFINPTNRKTIKTYPSLTKLYFDYLKTTSTPMTSAVALDFLSKFDTSWVKLIEQFIPATSIVNAGKKVQNSTFLDNKFIYKHGKNSDVNWLGTDGSEFQQGALKPVYLGTTNVTENKGIINESILGQSPTFQISGKQGAKLMGVDPTVNEYFGVHYGMFEYCDDTEGKFYIWESGVDYGDDNLYGGNINREDYISDGSIVRYGVFVIYDNKLYRLKTIAVEDFNEIYQATNGGIHTAGQYAQETTQLTPNLATITYYIGSTPKTVRIWEHIPMNVDTRSIVFEDSHEITIDNPDFPEDPFIIPAIGAEERSFYMNTIGKALAYTQLGVGYDCPPPKPHVCYYDFSGKTINLSAFTTTLKQYTDQTNATLFIKQPRYYGYSKNYTAEQPDGVTYGTPNRWVTDYKKRFKWESGKTYYRDEIIANINPNNKDLLVANSNVYMVTGTSITATGSYPTTPPAGTKFVGKADSNGLIITQTPSPTVLTHPTIILYNNGYSNSIFINITPGNYRITCVVSSTEVSETLRITDGDTLTSAIIFESEGSGYSVDVIYNVSSGVIGFHNMDTGGQGSEITVSSIVMTSIVQSVDPITPGGMYERYQDRTKTDPFMHVDTAYINKINLNPTQNVHSINLTKSLNLAHIFSGNVTAPNTIDPTTTYRVTDNIVNNELFISDSISVSLDGFYHLDSNKIGPFYVAKEDNIFLHTLNDSLQLQANTDNYVSIQSLNDNFNVIGNDLTLVGANPGYYLITKNSFLNFNFNLYFESASNVLQTVEIKLVNNFGDIYDIQTFDFIGDDSPDLRQYLFQYSGFFNTNDRIYLVIRPLDVACTLSRYEKIDIDYTEPDANQYEPLNDPRFRLLFNSGFRGNDYISEGFSIKPIYNLGDLTTNTIQFKTSRFKYIELNVPEVDYTSDPGYLFNILFYKYYEKFAQSTFTYDTSEYDRFLGNDKIDFTFKLRGKNDKIPSEGGSTSSQSQTGVISSNVEFSFSFSDFYLGNTPNITEFNDVTNAISIAKSPKDKLKTYNRTISYQPKYSFYNGNNLGNSLEQTNVSLISYDDGLSDFTKLNYSFDFLTELKAKRRHTIGTPGSTNFGYYKLENEVYETEIYKAILDKAPLFNSRIINYELNDVVKFPIDNYKIVVDTPTGKTIQTKTVYRLYVCVNDIHKDHCYKSEQVGSNTSVQGEIHPIYRPRGSRSCFVPIERYNPANFTPWGYEDLYLNTSQNGNINDYIYKNIKSYTTESDSSNYKYGDVFIADYIDGEYFFKYVYQKPLKWYDGVTYSPGDFVLGGPVSRYRFFCARKTTTNNPLPDQTNTFYIFDFNQGGYRITNSSNQELYNSGFTYYISATAAVNAINTVIAPDPNVFYPRIAYLKVVNGIEKIAITSPDNINVGIYYEDPFVAEPQFAPVNVIKDSEYTNDYWFKTTDPFSHKNIKPGVAGGIESIGASWLVWDDYTSFSFAAARIPKTIPITSEGVPYLTTGTTDTYAFDGIVYGRKYNELLKRDHIIIDQSYQHLDEYETISVNRLFRSKPDGTGVTDIRNYTPITGVETDDYTGYLGDSRIGKTNIYLKPSFSILTTDKYYIYPFFSDLTSAKPLFEKLGRVEEKNNPNNWIVGQETGPTYDKTSLYLGKKYVVNRGVLYKYIGDGLYPSNPSNPYPTTEPYSDPTNWVEKDFCLVNKYTFYKDRTSVVVYESDVESLTSDVKNSLYFFDSNLKLKNGFTTRSFSGSTINDKLITALDKFYDITDVNRVTPGSHGVVDFRASGNDVILDYYPQKDQVGYPLTGEFMGKLKLTNPCGQTATTFFGLLFDTDVTLLDRSVGVSDSGVVVPQVADILPYVLRVIVNQSASANANIQVKYTNNNMTIVEDNVVVNKFSTLDRKYDVIPNTNVTITVTYQTGKTQTTFKSATINGNPLFVDNTIINTNNLSTELIKSTNSETRLITLKNVFENSTLYIDLSGILAMTAENTNNSAIFDVKKINISTTQL